MQITALDLAYRFLGVKEVPGEEDNPFILSMLKLDNSWPQNDEVPWCSAFVNYIAWLLRLPRSKSLRARSWLTVGNLTQLDAYHPFPGFDVVILKRGGGEQPGPEVIDAPGHVGFYVGMDNDTISILGGNQGNTVSVARFPQDQVLGYISLDRIRGFKRAPS